MNLSRRHFLQSTALLTLLSSSIASSNPTKDIILGGGRYKKNKDGPYQNILSVVTTDTKQVSLIPTHFYPHGIHQHVFEPQRLALFEKKGPGACEVDLTSGAVTRTITTNPKRYFYGHGCYSIDGTQLFCTESYLDSKQGIIAVRDTKTMQYLGEFPTYGLEPHECKLIDKGKILVATNAGGKNHKDAPCVTYIDIATQKLIEKVPLTNPNIGSGHLAIDDDGSLIVVSPSRTEPTTEQLGGVSIRPYNQKTLSLDAPEELTSQLTGEALSVAVHTDLNLAAVTHPSANKVTFWSTKNRSHKVTLELNAPRGVTLSSNNEFFLISYGDSKPKILKLPVATLNKKGATVIDNTFLSGSHIYNWSRGLTELAYPGPLI